MLGPLTPAAERALAAATSWAARVGSAEVQPSHVVLGLLDEEEGRAAQMLGAHGLAPERARHALAVAAAGTAATPDTAPALAAATQRLLVQARALTADTSRDRTVATEQLLLAALGVDSDLRQTLEDLGLAVADLETGLRAEQQPALPLDEPLRLGVSGEETDTARVLDAAANRAREALRVLEDYGRFALDDAFLCGQLKQLRHDLAETLAPLPPHALLAARDTVRDVGTAVSTEREQQRFSLADVVTANLKRLQEALRSLEEFGKLLGPDLGHALEALRYRAYTIERVLLLGAAARRRLEGVRLCVLITGAACAASLDWTIAEAVAGGAAMIQLREKELDDRALLDRARRVRACTAKLGVLFIMNDRPDMARLSEADGVHLGQDDLPVKEARRIVGPDALIGVSTHDLEQVRRAVLDGASYLGIGPTFPSGTKEFAELAGLEFVRGAAAETTLPAFVIGGVNLETVAAAVAAGARRVAVSQTVCWADDPRAAAAALCRALL